MKDHEEWVSNYRNIWKAVEEQLFVSFTNEPLKEGCYLNAKLNVYQDKIRTDFHGEETPYNQYFKATAALKVKSVYKQGSNYLPKVYVEEARIKPTEKCRLLSDSKDDYEWS